MAVRLVAGGRAEKVGATLRVMVGSRLIMLVGNMALGLLIVWAQYTNVWFLLLLPPLVWLLHQFYGHRLRGDDERQTWQEFAEATRGLNRLDERDAASAGIEGAIAAVPRRRRVEIIVDVLGGRPHVRGRTPTVPTVRRRPRRPGRSRPAAPPAGH